MILNITYVHRMPRSFLRPEWSPPKFQVLYASPVCLNDYQQALCSANLKIVFLSFSPNLLVSWPPYMLMVSQFPSHQVRNLRVISASWFSFHNVSHIRPVLHPCCHNSGSAQRTRGAHASFSSYSNPNQR